MGEVCIPIFIVVKRDDLKFLLLREGVSRFTAGIAVKEGSLAMSLIFFQEAVDMSGSAADLNRGIRFGDMSLC